jgi:Fe-S-cluster containining protein
MKFFEIYRKWKEIEEPSYLYSKEESKLWNLFRLKKLGERCLFNDSQSFKCKIHEKRPIACKVYISSIFGMKIVVKYNH